MPRIAAVIENPIQYHSPLFAHIARDGRLDLDVLYLTDRGVRSFNFHGIEVHHEASVLDGYKFEILHNRSPWKDSLGFLDNYDPDIFSKMAQYDAVWFHGYNFLSHWLGFAGCRIHGVPILLRGEAEDVLPRRTRRRIIKRLVLSRLFPRVSGFLCIGHHNRKFYESYGVSSERLFHVPYGVDNSWFRGNPGDQERWRTEIRRSLDITPDALVFVYCSKHRHPKRPSDAVKAFCALSPDPSTILLMLGDGPLRAEAEECFRLHNKGHRVIFGGLKPYPDLPKYFAASDALVFPSIENWGMALNEALASGLAIISSDKVVGAIDMVRDGVNGFTYEAGNVDMLAARIAQLAGDRPLVHRMKMESLRHSEAFSFAVATEGLVKAVDFVAGRPRRA